MKQLEATRLNGVNEYYFSKKLREIEALNLDGDPVLNLGIGNPDLAPPSEVLHELNASSIKLGVHGYQSYKGISDLRNAIATWSKAIYQIELDPDTEVLPLVGSKEGIMHITQAFVNPGDEVMIPNPGYPTYKAVADLVHADVVDYAVFVDESLNMEELEAKITAKTKLIWVNFPHMPTGVAPDKAKMKSLIELAKNNKAIIVNDNPYSTILTEEYFSIFQIEGAFDVCLELNSLSKSHNMAGWRIGWVAGKRELIDAILKVKSNMDSGMFFPLQKAAVKALEMDTTWINGLNDQYKKRREVVWEIMDNLNCEYYRKGSGLFVWAKVLDPYENASDLSDRILKKAKVFITPGLIFGSNGNEYVRISLCSSEDILKSALNRIVNIEA